MVWAGVFENPDTLVVVGDVDVPATIHEDVFGRGDALSLTPEGAPGERGRERPDEPR